MQRSWSGAAVLASLAVAVGVKYCWDYYYHYYYSSRRRDANQPDSSKTSSMTTITTETKQRASPLSTHSSEQLDVRPLYEEDLTALFPIMARRNAGYSIPQAYLIFDH